MVKMILKRDNKDDDDADDDDDDDDSGIKVGTVDAPHVSKNGTGKQDLSR